MVVVFWVWARFVFWSPRRREGQVEEAAHYLLLAVVVSFSGDETGAGAEGGLRVEIEDYEEVCVAFCEFEGEVHGFVFGEGAFFEAGYLR